MATYVFKAMDLTGAKATGQVEAESKQKVADQLKSRGLIVLDIKDKSGSKDLEIPFLNRIKATDLTIMTRQLSTMVSSGMTILRALYVLESQTENKKLQEILVAVRKDVEAGLPLSDAFEQHPKVFSPLFVAMTRAGETGGLLEQSLIRIADQLESEDRLRRQVKAAMVYPSVVISFALIVLLALVAFIVPVFVGVFKEFGGSLPTITKAQVTQVFRNIGYPDSAAFFLSGLCCLEHRLPQGAPTSPALANLVTIPMDAKLDHVSAPLASSIPGTPMISASLQMR